MPCDKPTPVPGNPPRDVVEVIDTRLYHLFHLCELIQDVASAIGPNRQINDVMGESISVVFGVMGDELKAARDELEILHHAILTLQETKPC